MISQESVEIIKTSLTVFKRDLENCRYSCKMHDAYHNTNKVKQLDIDIKTIETAYREINNIGFKETNDNINAPVSESDF